MPNELKTVFSLSKFFTKRYFRDRVALFFTFLFPLIFLLVFGGIFASDDGPNFKIAILNQSQTEFADGFVANAESSEVITVEPVEDFEEAKELLGRGELDGIIELPQDFGEVNKQKIPSGELVSYFDQSDQQLAQTFNTLLQSVLDEINAQFVQVEQPFTLKTEPIQTANLSQFDYTVAGLIGFSILSLGIFSMSEGFTTDKKEGSLRRLKVSPIKAWQLIVATAINRVFVGIMVVLLMFAAAVLIYGFDMRGDYFSFIAFSILSTICLFGFGMAIAGWAKNANQAAPISNLVAFPMMFLSGTFFPRFLMPEWLQAATNYLPLTPVIDGLRLILTEGKTLFEVQAQLAVILIWTIVIYFISFKIFRWE